MLNVTTFKCPLISSENHTTLKIPINLSTKLIIYRVPSKFATNADHKRLLVQTCSMNRYWVLGTTATHFSNSYGAPFCTSTYRTQQPTTL